MEQATVSSRRMSGWICFEDETARDWVLKRLPALTSRDYETMLLSDWVESLGLDPIPTEQEEAAFFKETLPAPLQTESDLWREAVRELRQAGVENADHAHYLFSQLPIEPKNQLLHFLVTQYLEKMSWDAQARLRLVADEVRSLLILPASERLIFVHSATPQAAFREIADAFSKVEGVRQTQYLGPLEIPNLVLTAPLPTYPRALTIEGSVLKRLDQIALHMAQAGKRGKQGEVFLTCDAHYRQYLKWKLASLGVSSADFFESEKKLAGVDTSATISTFELAARIRSHKKWKLAKRLQLEKRIRRLSIKTGTANEWATAYGEVFDDAELNEIPLNVSAKNSALETAAVRLFPWAGKIQTECVSAFFEHPTVSLPPSSILTPDEKRTMVRLGFGSSSTFTKSISTLHRPLLFISEPGLRKFPQELGLAVRRVPARSPIPASSTVAADLFSGVHSTERAPSLSATSTRSYLECPSKYFFQHPMGLYADKDPRSDIQLYFGVLAHKALEIFFRPKMDSSLESISLQTAFDKAFIETIREKTTGKSAWLRKEVLETLWNRIVESIPKLESQLDDVFSRRSVFGLEYEFRIEWEGVILKGRIDRVDRLTDGSLLLIDYKTGNVDFTPNHLAAGKDLQPWFYLKAVSTMPLDSHGKKEIGAGIVYYDLKGASVSRGLVSSEHLEKKHHKAFTRGHVVPPETWERLICEGEAQVKTVAQGIQANRFSPTPSATTCQFCDYFTHCRSSHMLEGAQ